MKKQLILLTLMSIALCSCGQSDKSTSTKENKEPKAVTTANLSKEQKALIPGLEDYLDTEAFYPDQSGKNIIIQNSLPKGGWKIEPDGIIGYEDDKGTHYGTGIFWNRIINETDKPIELDINFPKDSVLIPNSPPDSYLRLFLPPGSMDIKKVNELNYGIEGLKPYLDANFYKDQRMQQTIQPGEEYAFFVSMLVHFPNNGAIRTAFEMTEEGELLYRLKVNPFGATSIPGGKLDFKE